jgi:hypothetical protein
VVGFLATLITMSGFGDHHPGLRDHDDRNAHCDRSRVSEYWLLAKQPWLDHRAMQ